VKRGGKGPSKHQNHRMMYQFTAQIKTEQGNTIGEATAIAPSLSHAEEMIYETFGKRFLMKGTSPKVSDLKMPNVEGMGKKERFPEFHDKEALRAEENPMDDIQ